MATAATPTHAILEMSLSGSVNNMQRKPSKQLTYQSVTPASNMILKKKWDEKMYSIHRSKVHVSVP